MIVFDCDGTIVDSQAAIVEIMGSTFESYNLKRPERKDILLGVGLELGAGIQRLLPEENNFDIDNEGCRISLDYDVELRIYVEGGKDTYAIIDCKSTTRGTECIWKVDENINNHTQTLD